MVALSVSSSRTDWSFSIVSPALTRTRRTAPAEMVSPSSGSVKSVGNRSLSSLLVAACSLLVARCQVHKPGPRSASNPYQRQHLAPTTSNQQLHESHPHDVAGLLFSGLMLCALIASATTDASIRPSRAS